MSAELEVVYLITSLAPGEAGPEEPQRLIRAHWAIENKLHDLCAVGMNEDRVRAGARPLSTLRSAVVGMIRRLDRAIAAARETVREDRADAIQAVTGRVR